MISVNNFLTFPEMGVDDNPNNNPGKKKLRINTKIKIQDNEKPSPSPTAGSDKTVGRSLRLRQRSSAGNLTGVDAANSE